MRRHLRCWGAVGLPARRRHRTPGEGTAALGARRRFRQRTVSSSTWAPAPSPAFGQRCPHILRPCSGAGAAHFRDACADCPLREACTTSKAGRTIGIPAYEELVRAQRERCAGPELACRLPRGLSQGRAQVRPLDEAPPWGRRARVREAGKWTRFRLVSWRTGLGASRQAQAALHGRRLGRHRNWLSCCSNWLSCCKRHRDIQAGCRATAPHYRTPPNLWRCLVPEKPRKPWMLQKGSAGRRYLKGCRFTPAS